MEIPPPDEVPTEVDHTVASTMRGLKLALLSTGSRRWYLGGLVGCAWLVIEGIDLWSRYPRLADRIGVTCALALYALLFELTPTASRTLPRRTRLIGPVVLLACSFLLLPWLGLGVASLWTFVGVASAMSLLPISTLVGVIVALTAGIIAFGRADGQSGDQMFSVVVVTGSITLMMGAFARQIAAIHQLRKAQEELAIAAVEKERGRVARDLHDILGHSLTVITVKAELAGRLIDTDVGGARKEIADLEDLTRGALADVRATAAGFRGVTIASELANARSALESAGIRAELPVSADEVPSSLRELFGWTVREGVTNVVRHSRASTAVVRLGADWVEVSDDGSGPGNSGSPGSGLEGLRERVEAAGGRMTVGRTNSGGFRLWVGT